MHGFTQEAAETILGISWAFHWHFMGIWGSQVCGSCHFLGRHQLALSKSRASVELDLSRRLIPALSFLRKSSSAEKTACLSAHCGDFRQKWR
jgi:hypothetical protein